MFCIWCILTLEIMLDIKGDRHMSIESVRKYLTDGAIVPVDRETTTLLVEALAEAVYLLDPTEEDMQKKAGVYRIVTALEKLKEKST